MSEQSWHLNTGRGEGYDTYTGHTISGAAYVMFPAGKRAIHARIFRERLAYRSWTQRSERMGKQAVVSPLSPKPSA